MLQGTEKTQVIAAAAQYPLEAQRHMLVEQAAIAPLPITTVTPAMPMNSNPYTIAGVVSGTIIGTALGVSVGVMTLGLGMWLVPVFSLAGSFIGGIVGRQFIGAIADQQQLQRQRQQQRVEAKIQHLITVYDVLKRFSRINKIPYKKIKIRDTLASMTPDSIEQELINIAITHHKIATNRTKKYYDPNELSATYQQAKAAYSQKLIANAQKSPKKASVKSFAELTKQAKPYQYYSFFSDPVKHQPELARKLQNDEKQNLIEELLQYPTEALGMMAQF
ncbi:MAG: hypothetical protein Tsb005_14120 [Gammaproteobacteria bacterium]